ncbi:hypothetical protein DCAR_0519272 [Daucus carota subsp. sativus]|uniref:Uncharacterized protein n=1 Tax=Daucus carota subsp. sativus TaxID=79200 RepID=A0A161ZYZ4_DAUCS|nr:hypothetical protein DCAR_0519272 [Daucus carota subsp. sativus]
MESKSGWASWMSISRNTSTIVRHFFGREASRTRPHGQASPTTQGALSPIITIQEVPGPRGRASPATQAALFTSIQEAKQKISIIQD